MACAIPAIALMTLVLPEPERPNRPTMGASAENLTVEVEGPELLLDVNVDHRFATAPSGAVSHSDVARATIDRTTAMMLRRNAWASPPGTWVNV